jgi:hypothetical protein
MKTDINREGLTFTEWVCAAGVAVFDADDNVRPFSVSETVTLPLDEDARTSLGKRLEQVRRRAYLGRGGYFWYQQRYSTQFYPKKFRVAWLAGEDPTEWRAYYERKESQERARCNHAH